MANKNDLTAFNPQIAAFAMPQSSPLTEAGNAMIKGSDFIWAQKLNGIKAKAGELELKRAQQEYDKAEAINPIDIASKQAALDDSVKTYAQNDLLRPLALKEATAKANKAAFDDDTKEIKFNSELAKDRASISRDDAIASNYFASAREQNIKNSVLEDDVKQNNFRLNAYANLNDVKELDKNHKDAIGAILSDEKLNAKQKYENIRLRNGAYEKQRNAINSFEVLSRKDMPRGSAINPFETDMAFERLGGELPEYIKTADAQTRLAYKDAYVKTQTNSGLNKAVEDNGLSLNIKKRQPTATERTQITDLLSLSDQLLSARGKFTGAEQGVAQNVLHGAAKIVNTQDPAVQSFKNKVEYIRQSSKNLMTRGRILKDEYEDMMKALPNPNEWTDKDYMTKSDEALNKMIASMVNKIDTLEASGIDTRALREVMGPKIKRLVSDGYFYKDLRDYDENGDLIVKKVSPRDEGETAEEAFKNKVKTVKSDNRNSSVSGALTEEW